MTKAQWMDIGWHGGKSLLCALQLRLLSLVTDTSVASLLHYLLREGILEEKYAPLFSLVCPVVTAVLLFVLWKYYDSIDDRSFKRFCKAPNSPSLLRDRGFLTELLLTAATATPTLALALYSSLTHLALPSAIGAVISAVLSLLFVVGISLGRIKRLESVWAIQKHLRTGKEKSRVIKRIVYAVIFYASLHLLINLGISVLIPVYGALVLTLGKLLLAPILAVAGILLIWLLVIGGIRQLISRRKFMRRLRELRDRRELSFEIHGHPYLSVFSTKIYFGLTITDAPHPEGKQRADTVYQVAVANCKRRRGTVVLCDQNIYRFMYTFQFSHIARMNRMSAMGYGGVRRISVPGASWYRSHTFSFPDGEGEKILLVDPTPYILAIHGSRDGELIEQDNASELFGYTVYGKNSFLNMLERT